MDSLFFKLHYNHFHATHSDLYAGLILAWGSKKANISLGSKNNHFNPFEIKPHFLPGDLEEPLYCLMVEDFTRRGNRIGIGFLFILCVSYSSTVGFSPGLP